MSQRITRNSFTQKSLKIFMRAYSRTEKPYSTAVGILDEFYKTEIKRCMLESVEVIPKEYEKIPGPKQLPFIGNAWRFAPIIGQYKIHELDKVMWSLRNQYGKIVKVGGLFGHPDLLFVFDGEDIKKVFKREEGMPHRPSMPSLHYYKEELKKDFFVATKESLEHGPKWDAFRKQVQHILLPPSTAKKYIEPLDEIAEEFLTRMEDQLDERGELPEHFLSEIYKWALESVVRVSLNTRLGCLRPDLPGDSESHRIIDSINTFFWNVAEVELKMPVWRIYKNKAFRRYIGALENFRRLCLKYITESMHQMEGKSYDNVKEEDISIVERILMKTGNHKLAAVLALDLLLVGVDTTSIAAASTMYQLSQNPEIQEKLFEELRNVLPSFHSKVDAAAQENMPYLKACIKETLRMYPVIIGNGRCLQSDAIISGYKVPKGIHFHVVAYCGRSHTILNKTHVIFPHLVVSNSTEYIDNPNRFRPERWLKRGHPGCPANQKKIHPFISLPFGYGRRACLGRRFAETELNILLAKIFRRYEVEYNYGPLSYKITPTYVPEQPLKFKLTERNT